jgi:UDP-N-acetylmuramoyl-L-alanyl-D-glutamate--2,6-diaminopimelate ligase
MSNINKSMISEIKKSDLANKLRYARGVGYSIASGRPADKMFLIGVTGTDGKTSTCNLIYHLLKTSGIKVGLISTISSKYFDGTKEYETDTGYHVTSPDSVDMHAYLSSMVNHGVTHAVIECTSHALIQERYAGINFNIGIVTNITHEHLDYHETYDKYVLAKSLLFRRDNNFLVKERGKGLAIINHDDKCWDYLGPYVEEWDKAGYGFSDFSDFQIKEFKQSTSGMNFELFHNSENGNLLEKITLSAPMVGEYNAQNISAACIAVSNCGVDWKNIVEGLKSFPKLPGRFEQVFEPSEIHGSLIVDFAHTPNALLNVLKLAREITKGHIIVVFGCASARDVSKRPVMGSVAGKGADITILTAEDPRLEKVDSISSEIAVGLNDAGAEEYPYSSLPDLAEHASRDSLGEHYPLYIKIDDRRKAIITAVALSEKDDIVLICGKGHEKSMCFGTEETPWSDQDTVKEAVSLLERK